MDNVTFTLTVGYGLFYYNLKRLIRYIPLYYSLLKKNIQFPNKHKTKFETYFPQIC